MNSENRNSNVIVVGGGLAGLTAAAVISRTGRTVTLLEQSRNLGGRAATQLRDAVHFNLGAHALYVSGEGFRTLQGLGVKFEGAPPNPGSSRLALGRSTYPLPGGLRSLFTSRLFSIAEKLRLAAFLNTIGRTDPAREQYVSLKEWVTRTVGTGNAAGLLHALFRLSTYANDPEHQSAGSAIAQFQLSRDGVWYLVGGWQTLVEGLRSRIESTGGTIQTSSRVTAVQSRGDHVVVRTADGRELRSDAAILATAPDHVVKSLELPSGDSLREKITELRPASAGCLDVALSQLPRPEHRFALGLDRPMYFSVHSAAVPLGPEGIHVVHAMKYTGPGRMDPRTSETELEDWMDTVQPGWRAHVVTRRFLPNMITSNGIPLASQGGESGRPEIRVAGHPRVFLAGDWVGGTGQIADASVASGDAAARLALMEIPSSWRREPAHV